MAKWKRGRAWTPAEDAQLRQMWEAGLSGRAIADAMERTVPSVRLRRHTLGLPARVDRAAVRRCAREARQAREARLHRIRHEPAAISETDARWLAGVIDGSGCIAMTGGSGGQWQVVVSVQSICRQLVAACWMASGCGSVHRRHQTYRAAARVSWLWEVRGWAACLPLLRALHGYMRGRQGLVAAILRYPILTDGAEVSAQIEAERLAVHCAVQEWRMLQDLPAESEHHGNR